MATETATLFRFASFRLHLSLQQLSCRQPKIEFVLGHPASLMQSLRYPVQSLLTHVQRKRLIHHIPYGASTETEKNVLGAHQLP